MVVTWDPWGWSTPLPQVMLPAQPGSPTTHEPSWEVLESSLQASEVPGPTCDLEPHLPNHSHSHSHAASLALSSP